MEGLIFKLHNEYQLNEKFNNKINIKKAYNELIEVSKNFDWKNNEELFEKYNTLISCINHHLTRWN
jgi:hypothetical protein